MRRREGSDHPYSPVLVSDLYIPSLVPPEQLSAKVNGKRVVLLLTVTFHHLHQGFPQSVNRQIDYDRKKTRHLCWRCKPAGVVHINFVSLHLSFEFSSKGVVLLLDVCL